MKILQISQESTSVGVSFWWSWTAEKACDFIKKRLQRCCFLVKFAKFLRTPFSPAFQHFLLWLAFCLKLVVEKNAYTNEMCHLHDWNLQNRDYDIWELRNEYFVSRFLWMKIEFLKKYFKNPCKEPSVEGKWIIFRDFMLFRRKTCICSKLLYALESALFFNYGFTQTFLFCCFSWGFLLFFFKGSYEKIKITPSFSFSFISVF